MPIFKIDGEALALVKEKSVDLERDIQRITERNLMSIFGLEFVSGASNKEFALQNFRIDTLAFDPENRAFVIIEFKRDRSFSVIDQGYAYLALMLNNKADFILEYNEKTDRNLKKGEVDWSQSRIMFIANSFTHYQLSAVNFRDLPIELWQAKVFENSLVSYDQLKSPDSSESIKTISTSKGTIEKVSQEVKVYTIEDHLDNKPDETKDLFYELREQILALDPKIIENPRKFYVSYRLNWNFVEVEPQKRNLKIHIDLPIDRLHDPKGMGRDMRKIGHYGTGDTEVMLDNADQIPYVLDLIKQSYANSSSAE